MMSYCYLLGYVAKTNDRQEIGNVTVLRTKPIKTSSDVKEATEHLREDLKCEEVALISFAKLESE